MKEKCTSEAIVQGLRGTPKERRAALKCLATNKALRGYVIGFVKRNGGNEADGEDNFHDAILKLDERVRAGGLDDNTKIENYLQGIAKFLWLRKHKYTYQRTEALDTNNRPEEAEEGIEVSIMAEEKKMAIDKVLERIGEKCKELLRLYKLRVSMDDIATTMNFASANVAKNEAYRCRKKFREVVKANPGFRELLLG